MHDLTLVLSICSIHRKLVVTLHEFNFLVISCGDRDAVSLFELRTGVPPGLVLVPPGVGVVPVLGSHRRNVSVPTWGGVVGRDSRRRNVTILIISCLVVGTIGVSALTDSDAAKHAANCYQRPDQ